MEFQNLIPHWKQMVWINWWQLKWGYTLEVSSWWVYTHNIPQVMYTLCSNFFVQGKSMTCDQDPSLSWQMDWIEAVQCNDMQHSPNKWCYFSLSRLGIDHVKIISKFEQSHKRVIWSILDCLSWWVNGCFLKQALSKFSECEEEAIPMQWLVSHDCMMCFWHYFFCIILVETKRIPQCEDWIPKTAALCCRWTESILSSGCNVMLNSGFWYMATLPRKKWIGDTIFETLWILITRSWTKNDGDGKPSQLLSVIVSYHQK